MNELLTLFFPQWQGSGSQKDLYHGAMEIRDKYLAGNKFGQVEVSISDITSAKNNISGYDDILNQLQCAVKTVLENRPQRIFTIGGDCGTELAPVSYLNDRYEGNLTVIWFDAHGDLNTPYSSVSGKFHGMPLRTLLGEGDDQIVKNCLSTLKAEQIILAGCRELDPPEAEYIKGSGITSACIGELASDAILTDLVRAKGNKNIYIHLDLDVLDPVCFPNVFCPCISGMSIEALVKILKALREQFNIAGFSMVEYVPASAGYLDKLSDIVEYGFSI